MKLTVVTTVRNGGPYVAQAIESVLSQSIADFEYLIVDDASTDATPAILDGFAHRDSRVRVLRNDAPRGPYPSANRALAEALGGAIARQDADDVSPPGRFDVQLRALASGPDVTLVTGAIEFFSDAGTPVRRVHAPPAWQPRLEWELLFTNVVAAGGHVMFPRVVASAPVRFAERFRYAEDYELWCRLTRCGRVVCPREIVYRYRQHPDSITRRHTIEQYECLSRIRHDLQTPLLGEDVPAETIQSAARFWTGQDGDERLDYRSAHSVIGRLRTTFLQYVSRRWGESDCATLAVEIDAALDARLASWLYRSMKRFDAGQAADVLVAARSPGRAARICAQALGHAARSARRRLSAPHGADADSRIPT